MYEAKICIGNPERLGLGGLEKKAEHGGIVLSEKGSGRVKMSMSEPQNATGP